MFRNCLALRWPRHKWRMLWDLSFVEYMALKKACEANEITIQKSAVSEFYEERRDEDH